MPEVILVLGITTMLLFPLRTRVVRQPISVRSHPVAVGRWILNFGARRLRASRLAGKTTIPAYVDDTSDSFDQVIENLQSRREHGIVPPRWVFPAVTEAARGVVTGAPFDDTGKESPIWADFTKKVAAVKGEGPITNLG